MLMDVGAPAELLRFEQTSFGQGRRQSYLTIQNEGEDAIVALSGRMLLLDEAGRPVEERPVFLGDMHAYAGEVVTYHLALDGFPAFEDARLRVEAVEFLHEPPWAMNEVRLMDLTPPELPAGRDRVALVAVAGRDAVCFPERRGSLWVCACGRFNRFRWPLCRRCGRARDEAFETLSPEAVREAYRTHVESTRAQDDEKNRQLAEARREKRKQNAEQAACAARGKRRRRVLGRASLAVLGVLAAALLLFWLLNRPWEAAAPGNGGAAVSEKETVRMPAVDYLEPIGQEVAEGNG